MAAASADVRISIGAPVTPAGRSTVVSGRPAAAARGAAAGARVWSGAADGMPGSSARDGIAA
jgi:hypothetical protein